MGTNMRIALYAADEATAKEAAELAFEQVQRIEKCISSWDPASELSQLVAKAGTRPIKVSHDLWRCLRLGWNMAHNTSGALDITAGPVIRLWRRARKEGRLPTDLERDEVLARVGYTRITIYDDDREVFLEPGTEIDFGSIGKGYAHVSLESVFDYAGIPSYMVDFGGDIAVGEAPPGKAGWRIAVPGLTEPVVLTRATIATSGHAEQHVEIDGVRYSHILDARDGTALTNDIGVSVISAVGWSADGLATALCILGPEKAEELLSGSPSVALIKRDGKVIWKSLHWPDWRAASREIR